MIPEKMLELLLFMKLETLTEINEDLNNWISHNYDEPKINKRYFSLLQEFLTPYALTTAEKSE